jgi:hypothetical protein
MQDRLARAWAHSEEPKTYPYRRSAARPGHPARAQAQLLRSPGPRPRPSSAHACSSQQPTATCPVADLLRLPPHTASRSQHGGRCSVERPTLPRTRRTDTHAHNAHAPSTARSYRSMHRLHLILMDRFLFSYTYCD